MVGLVLRFAVGSSALMFANIAGKAELPRDLIFTQAFRYDAGSGLNGGERFPAGAKLRIVSNGQVRDLVGGFAASADACVSFDGRRVLFSGKQKAGDPWQIWQVATAGGSPQRITSSGKDAIRPFYLPADKIVYSQRTAHGFQLQILPVAGGTPSPITFNPGDHLATDVLQDGRILYIAPHPAGASTVHDIYAVYPDGSGVESYRCDHGRNRDEAREISSGDIIFLSNGKFARFTSARAVEIAMPGAAGEFEGPVAEIAAGELIVSHRSKPGQPYALCRWQPGNPPVRLGAAPVENELQPVLVRPRPAPKWFPSSLGDREGANLLCLNAYTSRMRIPAGSAKRVRVWAMNDEGAAVALGEAPVEDDGSFYVQVPSERPLRFELLNAKGTTIAGEKGWFWTRRGEQRVCVGCHAGPERAPDNVAPQVLQRTTDPVQMHMPVHGGAGGGK